MKKLIIILIAILLLQSCRSTEEIIQRNGFRPYPKRAGKGYQRCTQNYVGYGTYRPPHRRGVDR